MSILQHIYKTKTLAANGVYVLVFVSILLATGRFFIPAFQFKKQVPQLSTLNGFALKYDDKPDVSVFIRSIKSNHGFLCLGTSESAALPDGNYWEFLNNDTEIKNKFSILAGAGRTCGLYIPIFLRHRKEVDSLKIIYFINPVYWRTDLSKPTLEYWNRYSNYEMCKNLDLSVVDKRRYYLPVRAYFDELNFFQKTVYSVQYEIRQYRKSYFEDLQYLLYPDDYEKKLDFVSPTKIALANFNHFGKIDFDDIDTTWNISHSFQNKNWFNPIDENTNYRYEELTSFISVCRDLGIQATFILGPYNGKFITNYDKSSLAGYQQTTEKIRQLLINEKANFIDASDISFTVGAFTDHQHYSSYGAYLIYQKVKSYLNEKNPD